MIGRAIVVFLLAVAIGSMGLDTTSARAEDGNSNLVVIHGSKERRGAAAPLTAAQAKVSGVLRSYLADLRDQGITRADHLAPVAASRSTPLVRANKAGEVQVYVETSSLEPAALVRLEAAGLRIELTNETYGLIQGWVAIERLSALAERITPPSYATPRAGSVLTEGDAILNTDQLRALDGVDGTGVKVGVISDGVEEMADAVASGDLPPGITTFGTCGAPTSCDEGTAMLEIVHDLAPGAELGFCASATSMDFLNCLPLLKDTFGAQVIVDDMGFILEPYFEDGIVAQGVKAIGDDVVYVSAAGNDGTQHHQAPFIPVSFVDPDGAGTFVVHDSGLAAGQASSPNLPVTLQPGQLVVAHLQWDDPFDNATTDFNLVAVDAGGHFINASISVQPPEPPQEILIIVNPALSPVLINFQIESNFVAPGPHTVELFLVGPDPDAFNIVQGSIYGHPAVPNVLAVGAIGASDPGNDDIGDFSSQGPSTIAFPASESRPKPDVASIDGVSVTGTGGFSSTFFGTSAAAPHVAGMAALLKELAPGATPAQIRDAIRQGAVDLGAPGFDMVFGAGRSDALGSRVILITPVLDVVEVEGFMAEGVQGGPFTPSSKSYTLHNASFSDPLAFTASADVDWLEVMPASGMIDPNSEIGVTVSFTVAADALTPGSHLGTLSLVNATNGLGDTGRSAQLDVLAPPTLEVSGPAGLTVEGPQGGPFPAASVQFDLSNASPDLPLDFTASVDVPWLDIAPASGSLGASGTTSVTVSGNAGLEALPAGMHEGQISFFMAGSATPLDTRSATANVLVPGELGVEEGNFAASGDLGGPFTPGQVTLELMNGGEAPLDFSVAVDQSWLQATPTSGSLAGGSSTPVTLALTPEANALPAGTHLAGVSFADLSNGSELTRTASPVVSDPDAPPSGPLVASVLPSTRSIQLGDIATVFATMINAGAEPAIGCGIDLLSEVPAALSFQTFDPVELVTGPVNVPVDIVGAQAFVLTLEPSGSFGPSELEFLYDCQNTDPVVTLPALNTLGLLVSPDPVPDIVALAATLQGDGRVRAPVGGTGFFTVATSNVGIAGSITATADTGGVVLPLNLSLCQTDPVSGACLGAGPVDAASGVTLDIGAMEVPSFAIFATPSAPIPFMPASNRIFARFRNGEGVTLGATSVAFETIP